MNRIPLLISAAALTAATTLPAHAVATSSATLGPLTITLFDLDPLDGIDASVTFANTYYGYGSYVSAYAYDSDPYAYDSQGAWGTTDFEPVGISAATVMASSTAMVGGSGDASGTTLSASGSAAGTMNTQPFQYQYSQYSAAAYAPYYYYSSFTLSANTLLLVTATATVSADVTSAFDPYASYQYESAYAATSLYLYGPAASGSGGGSQSSSDGLSLSIGNATVYDAGCTYGYCYGPNAASDMRTVSVSFVNASGADLAGYFQASANVSGTSYVQAVPEPETYAMMLAGLLSLGFLTRRRRQA